MAKQHPAGWPRKIDAGGELHRSDGMPGDLLGNAVLGLADAVCLNDPITGQGSNNASKAAKVYMDAIVARWRPALSTRPSWRATFERYWAYARFVTGWTNAPPQPPPPDVLGIMGSAQTYPLLARRIANGFRQSARILFPWFAVPEEAEALILKRLAAWRPQPPARARRSAELSPGRAAVARRRRFRRPAHCAGRPSAFPARRWSSCRPPALPWRR